MVNKNNKKGFSLAEALISMLVLSIFFGIAAKMVTQRPKQEYIVSPHGFSECYLKNGSLYSSSTQENEKSVTECTFTPAKNVTVYKLIVKFNDSNIYYRILYEMNYKIKFTIDNNNNKITITNIEDDGTQKQEVLTLNPQVADSLLNRIQNFLVALLPKGKHSGGEYVYKYGSVEAASSERYHDKINTELPDGYSDFNNICILNPSKCRSGSTKDKTELMNTFCDLNPNADICGGRSENDKNNHEWDYGSICNRYPNLPVCSEHNNENDENKDNGGQSGNPTGDNSATSPSSTDNSNTSNVSGNGLLVNESQENSYQKISKENFEAEIELVTPKANIKTKSPGIYISW